MELGRLAGRFRENRVDGAFFEELSAEDMVRELGLTKLQAKISGCVCKSEAEAWIVVVE